MIVLIVLAVIFGLVGVAAVVVDRRDRRSGGCTRSASELSTMALRNCQKHLGRRR